MNYSFTSLGRFVSCPRMWMLHQLGFKEIETVPLQFGSYVHECVDKAIKAALKGEKIEVVPLTKACLPKYRLLTPEHLSEALGILTSWYLAFDPAAYSDVVTEARTEIPIADDVTIVTKRDFRGVLKANPEVVEVIDWKTGWKNDPEPYGPQVVMYLWPTQQEYPDRCVQGYLWWMRYKREAKCLVEVDAEEGKAWALGVVNRIQEAQKLPGDMGFPATPGNACRLCGVSWACLGGFVPQELTSEEEAKDVAAFALQLDSALAICKEALKRYLKDGGHVEVGGEYWGNYPKVSWKFEDIEAFKMVLEEAGCDPWEFLSVDGYRLKRLWRTPLGQKLEAMGEKKMSGYLTHRSTPPEEAAGTPE